MADPSYTSMHTSISKNVDSQQDTAKTMSETSAALKQYLPRIIANRLSVIEQLYEQEMGTLTAIFQALDKEAKDKNINHRSEAYQAKRRILGQLYRDFQREIERPYKKYERFMNQLERQAMAERAAKREALRDLANRLDE